MSALETALGAVRKPSGRYWTRIIMLLIASLLAWAFFAQIEEVVIAEGEVVPRGQVKTIQHLEGGIIQEIFVTEGQTVSAGMPLIRMDHVSSGTTEDELDARLDALFVKRERLAAEAEGRTPEFAAEIKAKRPRFVAVEMERFEAFRQELNGTVVSLKEQINQRLQRVKRIAARVATVRRSLKSLREEFAVSTGLLAERLTTRADHLRLQRQIEEGEGELAELKIEDSRVRASVAEARQQVRSEELHARSLAGEERTKVESEIAQVNEALRRASDRVRRTVIRSPIAGIVTSQRHHTIGGGVQPGEILMEVVPVDNNLIVEAKLSPVDVGYVRTGQPAQVKVATYDFIRYGGLEGEVIDISPDSQTDQNGGVYFKLRVRTDKSYIGDEPGDLPITSGMVVTVDVTTGEKTVLQYLLSPVLKLKSEAFRER